MMTPQQTNSVLQAFDLSGHSALVSGASSGIGRHFADVLAAAGANVALAARRVASCERGVEAIRQRHPGQRAIAVALDVTRADSVAAAVGNVEAALGAITILCNNAGVAVTAPFLEHTEADWQRVLETNLSGAYRVAQAVANHMVAHGRGGSIVNTASVLSFRVTKMVAGYAASKAGLMHLTRAMALELAPYRIRVNAIAPGYIETEINREFLASDAGQRLPKRIPAGRVGQLNDLDGALLLLASSAGRYITGSAISVDGGHATSAV